MKFDNQNMKIKVTPALARLHAHVSGDGCLSKVKTNRSKKELLQHPRKNTKRNRFHVRYYNNDLDLLNQFITDLKNVFSRGGFLDLKQNRVDAQGKGVYQTLKSLGAGKSHEWFISDEILFSSKEIVIEWIKSFFDDEAYVPSKRKSVEVNSVNKKGLYQIRELLLSLGIASILRGPYWTRGFFIYRLYIGSKSVRKYHELIGFNSLEKKKRLNDLVV